jgi:hypothetical protein
MSQATINFTTSEPGEFTLAHNLGLIPQEVIFELTSSGAIWFQDALYDSVNLYLVASDANISGSAIIYVGNGGCC